MTISAMVVADSISSEGKRLTTLQLRYPKFIHGEFMTHRVFSRNASSSRAIPVKKLIEDVRLDPAKPVFWGSNKPGMQAGAELTEGDLEHVQADWLEAMELAIRLAERMQQVGLHKQVANRIIEPFCHINVVVTATEWDNFFELRCHPDAQPEMRVLAEAMCDAQNLNKPTLLQPGAWHVPYVSLEEVEDLLQAGREIITAVKVSVARCARVSYLTHEGKPPNIEEDLKLYERLVGARPLHASPAEHQATPDEKVKTYSEVHAPWLFPEEHGNFVGWRQFRKQLEKDHTI